MLGKYNLIISVRGKSSAESLVLLFSIISPQPVAEAHSRNTITSPSPVCTKESPELHPVPRQVEEPLLNAICRALILPSEGPGAGVGRDLFRGRGFAMYGWQASLSFLLCPEQYMGSEHPRRSRGLGKPWKPGPGWVCSSGMDRGQAAGTGSHPARDARRREETGSPCAPGET